MVPYRGRLALRIIRIMLAAACLAWYVRTADERFTSLLALLAAYLVYAAGVMFEVRLDSPARARIALLADTAFFGLWSWIAGSGYVGWPAAGWLSAFLCAYLLASSVLLHDLIRATCVAAVAIALAALFAPHGDMQMVSVAAAVGSIARGIFVPEALYRTAVVEYATTQRDHSFAGAGRARSGTAAHRRRFSRRTAAKLHQFSDAPGDCEKAAGARRSCRRR